MVVFYWWILFISVLIGRSITAITVTSSDDMLLEEEAVVKKRKVKNHQKGDVTTKLVHRWVNRTLVFAPFPQIRSRQTALLLSSHHLSLLYVCVESEETIKKNPIGTQSKSGAATRRKDTRASYTIQLIRGKTGERHAVLGPRGVGAGHPEAR